MEWIPITKPSITNLEISYVNDAITNGWGEKCYDYIYKFENSFADYIGSKHCLATSCCTGAIHLALLSTGIQAGDEVIVPDITWIASVEPILYIGAKPVFVDILEDSWCIDPSKIESSITPKTKAIMVVHLYGNLVEMDEILSIAKKYNLVVIEDAAEGFGSEYKGKKAGSIGDIGVFSFHGTKTLTTGEGGMLVTNNPEYYERAAILNHHGQDPKVNKMFWMKEYGYKYKMSNLQAALGCAQIERADELVDKKREIFNWYKETFIETEEITLNPEPDYTKNSYWMPTIVINKKMNFNREDFMKYLKKNKIDSRPFFYPLSSLPMFKEMKENKVAYKIYKKGINLPCAFHLKKKDIDRICKCIIDYNY
ncbi:DegT/DnrJ/EryC1/StrS family aminotransferase [bacterium AH-315-M05]|nr:DegT/DnrJ/EryC1/StrS family aminotransferase [bacterium AH-315-M05]